MCLDWLFNMQIPESTDKVVVIRPSGKTFVTGLASCFDEEYDNERLTKFISQHDYSFMMERLNDNLGSMFPCNFCWIIGYLLCPFTLGLSFWFPKSCVDDAEVSLRRTILRNNRKYTGIKMELIKRRGTSWIEISLPDEPEPHVPKNLDEITIVDDDVIPVKSKTL